MDSIGQHFRPDEMPLIDRLQGQIAQSASEYRPILTTFLDPRQLFIAQTLAAREEVPLHSFGGFEGAERQRVIFAPDYFQAKSSDYALCALNIHYPEKFATLTHSQVLGTLANSGIDRELFGDILNADGLWQTVVAESIGSYIQDNVDHIGKVAVRLEPIALEALVSPQDDWEPAHVLMSSLRLDSLISHAYHLSRARAKALVEAERVRLNFATTTAPDAVVAYQDIVSVRGFGRIRLAAEATRTKKGKFSLDVELLHNK